MCPPRAHILLVVTTESFSQMAPLFREDTHEPFLLFCVPTAEAELQGDALETILMDLRPAVRVVCMHIPKDPCLGEIIAARD